MTDVARPTDNMSQNFIHASRPLEAGAALLGPVGLLAGLLLGGKGTDVTFIAQFKDGRKMLATTDAKAFTKLQALVF